MDNHRQLTPRTSMGLFFPVAFRSPEMATSKPPGYRPPAGHPAGLGHLTVNSTQVTNRAPGAEGTSRRKNTHRTDRGLRVPFADKTRLCPLWTLASLVPMPVPMRMCMPSKRSPIARPPIPRQQQQTTVHSGVHSPLLSSQSPSCQKAPSHSQVHTPPCRQRPCQKAPTCQSSPGRTPKSDGSNV